MMYDSAPSLRYDEVVVQSDNISKQELESVEMMILNKLNDNSNKIEQKFDWLESKHFDTLLENQRLDGEINKLDSDILHICELFISKEELYDITKLEDTEKIKCIMAKLEYHKRYDDAILESIKKIYNGLDSISDELYGKDGWWATDCCTNLQAYESMIDDICYSVKRIQKRNKKYSFLSGMAVSVAFILSIVLIFF